MKWRSPADLKGGGERPRRSREWRLSPVRTASALIAVLIGDVPGNMVLPLK